MKLVLEGELDPETLQRVFEYCDSWMRKYETFHSKELESTRYQLQWGERKNNIKITYLDSLNNEENTTTNVKLEKSTAKTLKIEKNSPAGDRFPEIIFTDVEIGFASTYLQEIFPTNDFMKYPLYGKLGKINPDNFTLEGYENEVRKYMTLEKASTENNEDIEVAAIVPSDFDWKSADNTQRVKMARTIIKKMNTQYSDWECRFHLHLRLP